MHQQLYYSKRHIYLIHKQRYIQKLKNSGPPYLTTTTKSSPGERGWHNERCVTHPEMEKREKKNGPVSSNMIDMSGDDTDDDMDDGKLNDYLQYQCDHITHYDDSATWSLQDA
ncbi:unnamed protein product, partial [Rotaria sp. Silwood2]